MSFDVSPLNRVIATSSIDRPSRSAAGANEGSFRVSRDDAGVPPIPAEVWEQVDAAARLAEDLQAQGRAVRFDVHKLDGGVVANLVDEHGLLRPLLLPDVVDVQALERELDQEP